MKKSLQQTLDDALAAAVQAHFVKLFSVMMTDPSADSLQRFERGLQSIITVYEPVLLMIENIPPSDEQP
jgi:hypothetical protein